MRTIRNEAALDLLWADVLRSDEVAGNAVREANDPRGSEQDCERRQMALVVAKAERRSALLAYIVAHGYHASAHIDEASLVALALKLEIPRKRAVARAA